MNIPTLRCLRCGHEWYPRSSELPGTCPKCKSPYWDKERKRLSPVSEHGESSLRSPRRKER